MGKRSKRPASESWPLVLEAGAASVSKSIIHVHNLPRAYWSVGYYYVRSALRPDVTDDPYHYCGKKYSAVHTTVTTQKSFPALSDGLVYCAEAPVTILAHCAAQNMGDRQVSKGCADCGAAEASVEVRQRSLCHDCFVKYVSSKPIKRIDSYRFKIHMSEPPRRLLLALSGGVSSLILLQVLDRQLQRQRLSRGRTAYMLHVCMVESPLLNIVEDTASTFSQMKAEFPSHSFSLVSLCEIFQLDDTSYNDLSVLGIQSLGTPQASLESLVSRTSTASSRADILQILLNRLIVASAKSNDCSGILWGHSDSRLAAKVLSSVAKGRGGGLPLEIGDGMTPSGLTFYYPMRDLFKSELLAYAKTLPNSLPSLVIPDVLTAGALTSVRATSIDDLISKYIETQGERYPSIMANVVRTAGKLCRPSLSPSSPAASTCSLCKMPNGDKTGKENGDFGLCNSCLRLKSEMNLELPR